MPSQRKISALQALEIETADDSGIVPHKKKDEEGPNVLADFSACMYKYEEEEAFEEAFNAIRSNVETQTWLDSIFGFATGAWPGRRAPRSSCRDPAVRGLLQP